MKKNVLKTMLVAVAFLFGMSAYVVADDDVTTYFSQDYEAEDAEADWTTATSGRFDPVLLTDDDDNTYLAVTQDNRSNNGTTITSTSLQSVVEAGTDFTMSFDLRIGSSNNQTPVVFSIYDEANTDVILSLTATGTYATTWYINDQEDNTITLACPGWSTSYTIDQYTWYSFQISRSGSLTYLTVTDEEDEAVFEQSTIYTASSTGGLGNMTFVTKRYFANFAIDNVVVRSLADGDVPDVATATYTIKYVDESGDSIKADRVAEGVVGDTVEVLATDMASFYNDDSTVKYIYSSNDSEGVTIAEDSSTVVTITFREAGIYSYTYTAVDSDDNIIATLADASGFEADDVTVFYPEYINVDGTLWYKAATSSQFSIDYTLESDGQTGTLSYSNSGTTNCILLIEGEDIEGAGACSGNCEVRSSMGGAGYFTEDVTLTTLTAGTYQIYAVLYGGGSSYASYTQPITVGDYDLTLSCSTVNYQAVNTSEFTIEDNTYVVIGAADLAGVYYGIDYLYIVSDDGGIAETTEEDEEDEDSDDDGTTTIVFAMDDADNVSAYTVSPESDVITASFELIGDSLSISGTGTLQQKDADGNAFYTDKTYIKVKNTDTSKSTTYGVGQSQPLAWNVIVAEGYTFTPTKVSGYIARGATDVADGVTVWAITESDTITLGTYTALRYNRFACAEDTVGTGTTLSVDGKTANNPVYYYEVELDSDQQATLAVTGATFSLQAGVGIYSGKEGWFGETTITGIVEEAASDSDTETGISNVNANAATDAVIDVYNLTGIKVMSTTNAADINSLSKGLYIINGKKVVIQ